jgi:diaminohydroxyphosphoribosylaminopyrimidine deaminase/5-amino-6-(5-phosphoribosylamino)uracil reductase
MDHLGFMELALNLARRGYGKTSPNPMVGAVLVKQGKIIGRGWHRRAGEPHAEIEAIRNAHKTGSKVKGATLYVTLEPCCTYGRTPPCTSAIIDAGIKKVIVGAIDPNPQHCGKALRILQRAGVAVVSGVLGEECAQLNEAFNHWIVERTPLVTVKAAMTLDGKIATAAGQSKWITSEAARAFAMKMRQGSDAVLAGINTILADNPSLTVRARSGGKQPEEHRLRRIILDSYARTPLSAKVVTDEQSALTTIVVTHAAAPERIVALNKRVRILVAPKGPSKAKKTNAIIPLRWLLKRLGAENVTSLLIEGGGEVNWSFLSQGLAHRIAFFYAPKILGGSDSIRAVGGPGAGRLSAVIGLNEPHWRRVGRDLLLISRIASR